MSLTFSEIMLLLIAIAFWCFDLFGSGWIG